MQPLLDFYTRLLKVNGPGSPHALGWRDAHSQLSRFAVLASIADLTGVSILDEGCGVGDLYPYLTERFSGVRYTGIDVNESLIQAGKQKYPKANLSVADFSDYQSGPFDYVFSSGALTFKIPNHREVYFGHIKKMFQLAGRGVAFNMLDSARVQEDDTYATYDPLEVHALCRTLTERIAFRHDYSDEDFTFYLYRT